MYRARRNATNIHPTKTTGINPSRNLTNNEWTLPCWIYEMWLVSAGN